MKPTFESRVGHSSTSELFQLVLIPDLQEYEEQITDELLTWVDRNDPNSRLKNFEMVNLDSRINFFCDRNQVLERERDEKTYQRHVQCEEAIAALQDVEPPVDLTGPEYQVEERRKQWREEQARKYQQRCDQEITLITNRYNHLIQQCQDRIAEFKVALEDAERRWWRSQSTNQQQSA